MNDISGCINQKNEIHFFCNLDLITNQLNRIPDVSILYTNSTAQKYFGLTTQEMIESGPKHMVENYHPSTFTDVMPKVSEFGKHGDDSKVFGFSQFLRRDKDTEFEGMLGFAKISKKLNCFVCIENPVSVFGDLTKNWCAY